MEWVLHDVHCSSHLVQMLAIALTTWNPLPLAISCCEVYQNFCVLQAKQLCAAELQLHAFMNAFSYHE